MEELIQLPIKVLLDDNYKEFIPFVPTNALFQYGTGKTAEELFAERYTKEEVDKLIEELGTLLRLAGIVNSRSDLPKTAKPGDVYIINEATNATEVVWLGEKWEDLGPLIDLTQYVLVTDAKEWIANCLNESKKYTDSKTDSLLSDAEQYTDDKLESFKEELSNYVKAIDPERVASIVTEVLYSE